MKTKEITLPEQTINVSQDDNLYVSIKIGNGQIGGSIITNLGKVITKGVMSELTHFGNLRTLEEDKVTIRTNILDVNAYSNNCVMSTTITNQDNKVLYSKIDNENAPSNGVLSFVAKYVFKVLSVFLIFAIFSGNPAYSQNSKTPNPSLMLFDNGHTNSPGELSDLSISLLGVIESGGSIEFSPFWLIPHPELTIDNVYKSKFPILYNSSISVASLKLDSVNNFALGFRTRIFQHRNNISLRHIDSLKTQIQGILSEPDIDTTKLKSYREAFVYAAERPTFYAELAGASGSEFEAFKDIVFNRYSLWINMVYRQSDNIYFSGILRYSNDNTKSRIQFFDTGLSINYEKPNFYFGLELAKRFQKESNLKIVFASSLKLNEFIFLSCALGKNFNNSLIAIGGVNVGLTFEKLKI